MEGLGVARFADDVSGAALSVAVAAVVWLAARDLGLALEMRTDFCREWDVSEAEWNGEVAAQADYAGRQGSGTAMYAAVTVDD